MNISASPDDDKVNRIAEATSAFRKLHHRIWNKRDIKLETSYAVNNVLSSMCRSSGCPIKHKLSSLIRFTGVCLSSILGYTRLDRIFKKLLPSLDYCENVKVKVVPFNPKLGVAKRFHTLLEDASMDVNVFAFYDTVVLYVFLCVDYYHVLCILIS